MARKWFFWAALTARGYVLHDSEWKKIVTRGPCLADRRPQQIEVRTQVPLRGPRHAASAASVWSLRKVKSKYNAEALVFALRDIAWCSQGS